MSLGALMLSQMAPAMLQGIGGGIGGEVAKAEIAKKMKPFQEAFDAALKKHGMDKLDKQATGSALMSGDPNAARKLLSEQAPSLDHGAFIADVIGALDKLGGEASGKATQRFDRLSGVLSELKIDGDKATGKINGTPAEFVKVAGRWYFSIKNQR